MMHCNTVKGHRRLMRALTIQAALPIFTIFPPILLYGLYHLEIINFTAIEYLVYTLFSLFPAISPLVTLYYVRPYKRAVKALLGLNQTSSTEAQKDNLVSTNSKPY
ncbi:hypothetical protein WR25_09591 [Diploscapter pachys]|uniref:G-protein coupled receptors family 1 profile domain-containing protein n=1 Tax=Diploscapter pachys TaxID=2018661 RepID=A0A2A2KXD4_9BILA|nr:hypothetical protein WR25_09591 [Diploscapter pachys]